jgi:hypothetical protein
MRVAPLGDRQRPPIGHRLRAGRPSHDGMIVHPCSWWQARARQGHLRTLAHARLPTPQSLGQEGQNARVAWQHTRPDRAWLACADVRRCSSVVLR